MSDREQITFGESVPELIMKMAEGNPGAARVMMDMIEHDEGRALSAIMHLDDMNMRGEQIWVGYKDYCGQNIEDFIKCAIDHDDTMIEKVNEQCCYEPGKEKAVKKDGSIRDLSKLNTG